jgi:hypothetical protein
MIGTGESNWQSRVVQDSKVNMIPDQFPVSEFLLLVSGTNGTFRFWTQKWYSRLISAILQ